MKKSLKIIVIFFVILIISNKNIAKYIEKINISSKNKIAKPIINIEKDEKIIITKIDLENVIEYKFKIKNYNETNKTNIEFLYYLEIETNIQQDLVELKLMNETKNEQLNLIENKTDNFKIPKEKFEAEYKLIARLKSENLNGNINIKIGVVQSK